MERSQESGCDEAKGGVPSEDMQPVQSEISTTTGAPLNAEISNDELVNISNSLIDTEELPTSTSVPTQSSAPTVPTSISQYFQQGENSAEQVRQRLHTALAQTRMLRHTFTERLYDKHRVVLKPVPASVEDIIETITARPKWVQSELLKRMNYTLTEKESEKKEAQELNAEMNAAHAAGYVLPILRSVGDVDNAEQLSWIASGLSLVILPEDENVDVEELRARGIQDRGPFDLQTGEKVPDISSAAATAGHAILERVRKGAWLRSERKRKRDQIASMEHHEDVGSLQYPMSSVSSTTSLSKMMDKTLLSTALSQSFPSDTIIATKIFQKLPEGKKGKVQSTGYHSSQPTIQRLNSKKPKSTNTHLLSLSAQDERVGSHGRLSSAACALLAHRHDKTTEVLSSALPLTLSNMDPRVTETHYADQSILQVLKPFTNMHDHPLHSSSSSPSAIDVTSLPLDSELQPQSKENSFVDDQTAKSMNSTLVLSILYAIGLVSESPSPTTDAVSITKNNSNQETSSSFVTKQNNINISLKLGLYKQHRPSLSISESSISNLITERCKLNVEEKLDGSDNQKEDKGPHSNELVITAMEEKREEGEQKDHPQEGNPKQPFYSSSEDPKGPMPTHHSNVQTLATSVVPQKPALSYSRSDTLQTAVQTSSLPYPIPKSCNADYRYDGHLPTNSMTGYLYPNPNYIHSLPYTAGLSPYQLAQLPTDSQHAFMSTKMPSMMKDVANSSVISQALHTSPRNSYPGAINTTAWPATGFIGSFGGHISSQPSLINSPNPMPLNPATRMTFSGSYTQATVPINPTSVPLEPSSVPLPLINSESSQASNGNKSLKNNKTIAKGDVKGEIGKAQVICQDPSPTTGPIAPCVDKKEVDTADKQEVIVIDDGSDESIANKISEDSSIPRTEQSRLAGPHNELLSKMFHMESNLDEVLPNLQLLIPLVRELRIFALKTICRERALLVSLMSRNIRMSESFSHSYTSAMVRAGEVLGYEALCEIVKDGNTRSFTLFPFDVLSDVSGAWEDPCKATGCYSYNLVGEELTRRAHARALLQKSLRKLQDRYSIKGGITNEGPYGEPSLTRGTPFIKRSASISLPVKATVPVLNRSSSVLKRKSSFCSTSDMTIGLNSAVSSLAHSNCYSNPYFVDMDEIENKPYGRYGADESSRSPSEIRPFIYTNPTKRMRAESHSSNLLMTRSTYEIEWTDIANLFQTISLVNSSGDKLPLPRTLSNQSDMMFGTSSTIFAPYCRKVENGPGYNMDDNQESDTEEDITDSRLLKSHQIVLDKMKEKLDAIMAIRRKYQDRSRKK